MSEVELNPAAFLQAVHQHMTLATKGGDLDIGGYVWLANAAGEIHVYALDLDPPQSWALALAKAAEPDTRHLVFALDRYGKPHQGTTLGDLLAGVHIDRSGPAPQVRPFTVEYTAKPEHRVLWFNWGNEFWNTAICFEMLQAMKAGPDLAGLSFSSLAIDPDGSVRQQ